MAINATVDGVTYSGVDTIKTGGKNIALEADAGANYGAMILEKTISYISDDSVTFIRSNALANQSLLTYVSLPNLIEITVQGAFINCSALSFVSMERLTGMESRTFYGCTSLSEITLLLSNPLALECFRSCNNLRQASFPNINGIRNSAFEQCRTLLSLYLMSTSVVLLSGSYAFYSTPIEGYTAETGGQLGSIYVPASLLTAYQSATNWAFFSERFVGV